MRFLLPKLGMHSCIYISLYVSFRNIEKYSITPSKKQAMGVPSNNFIGMLHTNISPWNNISSFHPLSGNFSQRFFDSEANRAGNFDSRSTPSVGSGINSTGRKFDENVFSYDSSFGLSMSHLLEDLRSGLNYGGIRKVKVSQVKDSDKVVPGSMECAFSKVDGDTMSLAHSYDKDENIISMGVDYNKGEGSAVSISETYDQGNNIFISMGKFCNKGADHISMSQTCEGNDNAVSIGDTFSKDEYNITSIGQTYTKADANTISMGHIYSKGNGSLVSADQTFDKDDNSNTSIGQSYSKGESTVISFGCYDDNGTNCSGKITSSYELLIAHPYFRRSEVRNDNEFAKPNVSVLVSAGHIGASHTENVSKKKDDMRKAKKVPTNNFPSNVRSLLSTGMLDGVPVKYIAWSREKELHGVIKGSGYLCGCQMCNFSQVVNAYEFERHANCKTKHPNNHIYFENGKTIYSIVQELRSMPQDMLFEVIQTITGSSINQKSFCLWKESFLAAARELQRIYGKDEG